MTILSDEAKTLLETRGLFVMPQEIDHEAFNLVVYVCALYADKPLTFHCQGDGGDCTAAMGIVDVIRHHGRVTGLLAGEANSCSGVIFAACNPRYVYPYGSIGIHASTMDQISRVDRAYAHTWTKELETTDRQFAEIYSDASDTGVDYWHEMIKAQGGNGYNRLNASMIINRAMAHPISEMPK